MDDPKLNMQGPGLPQMSLGMRYDGMESGFTFAAVLFRRFCGDVAHRVCADLTWGVREVAWGDFEVNRAINAT